MRTPPAPSPGDARPASDLARPPGSAPARPRRPRRALTSWGPASVAPPVWRPSVGLQRPPPLPPSLLPRPWSPPKRCPGLEAGGPRDAGRCGAGRGGERAARVQEVTTLPHGRVRAPGRGRREPGEGAGAGACPEPAGLAPERPARTGQEEARGADVPAARVVRCGRASAGERLPRSAGRRSRVCAGLSAAPAGS